MTKRNRIIAILVSVVMIISMFAMNVFAHSETATDEHGHAVGTHEEEHQSFSEWATENKSEIIVNIVVFGLILIVATVLIIKFRHRLGAFLRSVKSEIKKIVWASGSDTRKNFLVVVVIAVVIALAIGIFDYAFSEGINGIVKLLNK